MERDRNESLNIQVFRFEKLRQLRRFRHLLKCTLCVFSAKRGFRTFLMFFQCPHCRFLFPSLHVLCSFALRKLRFRTIKKITKHDLFAHQVNITKKSRTSSFFLFLHRRLQRKKKSMMQKLYPMHSLGFRFVFHRFFCLYCCYVGK